MILPEGFDTYTPDQRKSDCDILYHGEVVGGVLTCPYPRKFLKSTEPPRIVPLDITRLQAEVILQAMENADAPGTGWKHFDQSMQSCDPCDYIVWFGNRKEEYEHHLYLLDDGVVSLWFDLKKIDKEDADFFASGFTVKHGGFS
ncbi:MAG: hypothetical protein IJ422_07770 [Oscillospiraceae bacterium]|nr:hypothetical protein [Oscillospiraceae bacterium]